jgi:hypothetical protein
MQHLEYEYCLEVILFLGGIKIDELLRKDECVHVRGELGVELYYEKVCVYVCMCVVERQRDTTQNLLPKNGHYFNGC